MLRRFAPYWESVRERWDGLSQNRRVAIVAVGLAALFTVALLLLLQPPQQYAPLFTGLSADDAAAIIDQLRQQGVPYKLSNDGTTISVPVEQVAKLRLALAAQGLPKSGTLGFELFDRSSFGVTDFQQRVNYQRALEGELARTISQLDGVRSARVHLVIPEESLFSEQQQPTTAAVVLQLKPGSRLTDEQVRGVVHLVSASVPGLQPEHVTVVDESGNALWSGGGVAAAGGMSDHLKAQRAFETVMATQLQTVVARVVGNNNAAVQVSASFDWDQRQVDSEIYSPNGTQPQVRSQQERVQTSEGTASGPIGIPGVDSNVGSYQEGAAQQNQQRSELRETTVNYELSRQVERVVQAPGKVQRLSVAVVLNSAAVDPAVAEQVRDLVAAAAGIVPERGDQVTVSVVPFTTATAEESAAQSTLMDRLLEAARLGAIVLIPLLALLIAWRVLAAQRSALPPVPRYEVATGVLPGAAAGAAAPSVAGGGAAGLPGQAEAALKPPSGPPPTLRELQELAKKDPATVAHVVRAWLNEE